MRVQYTARLPGGNKLETRVPLLTLFLEMGDKGHSRMRLGPREIRPSDPDPRDSSRWPSEPTLETSKMKTQSPAPPEPKAFTVTVELDGGVHTLGVASGETIFAALHREGLCPPFSCVAGVCGECVATLDSGEVAMEVNRALSAKQLDRGLILTCQATPRGDGCRLRFGDLPRLE